MLEDSSDLELVGDLGRSLAKLAKDGARIARGFVVPRGERLRNGLSNEVMRFFDRLGTKDAVLRSSQREHVEEVETLHGVGREQLLGAIEYMQSNARRRGEKAAIVVQKSLDAETAGVAFSANPSTRERHELIIEASLWGGGTVLKKDDEEIEKDRVLINKNTGALLLEDEESEICLGGEQIQELYNLVRKIERRAKRAVRVDWAYDSGRLFILRAQALSWEDR